MFIIRLKYNKGSELRFISHLDLGRVFCRAMARAELPVAYSQGHHPRPRVSYGPPLAVGFTSLAEYLDLALDRPVQPKAVMDRLNRALPNGLAVMEACYAPLGLRSVLMSEIEAIQYVVHISTTALPTARAHDHVESFLSKPQFTCLKKTEQGSEKELDLKKWVERLEVEQNDNETRLTIVLKMEKTGSCRPQEVLTGVFGLQTRDILLSRVERTAVRFGAVQKEKWLSEDMVKQVRNRKG